MAKKINFVNRTTGKFYGKVLRSMIEPITSCLPEGWTESRDCMSDSLNIHFFREKRSYFDHLHFKNRINLFISHGIADKNWRNAQFVDVFNYIFVSGPSWVKKMVSQGIPKSKLLVNGYTKLDPIFQGKYQRTESSKKRILWGPTHNLKGWTLRRSVSSYPSFETYLNKFPKDVEIIVSPHPANSNDGNPTMQALVDCDAVISDCSSIIYEAWALNKPVIFPDWLVKGEILRLYKNSFEAMIFQKGIGLHAKDAGQLVKLAISACEKGISEREREFIDGIFPAELRGKSGEKTAGVLRRLSNEL